MLRSLLVVVLVALASACSNDPTGAWSGSGDFQNVPSFGFLCMYEDGAAAFGFNAEDFEDQVALGPCCQWSDDGSFSGSLDGQWSLEGNGLELTFNPCDGPGCVNRLVHDDSVDCARIQP